MIIHAIKIKEEQGEVIEQKPVTIIEFITTVNGVKAIYIDNEGDINVCGINRFKECKVARNN